MRTRLWIAVFAFLGCLSSTPAAAQTQDIYERGVSCGKAGEVVEAVAVLRQARANDAKNQPVFFALRVAEDVQAGLISVEASRLVFESIELGNRSRWEEAIELARRARDVAAQNALVWVHLGSTHARYFVSGGAATHKNEATKSFRRALEISPGDGIAHHNLALAELAEGRLAEAREHLELAEKDQVPINPTLRARIQVGPGGFFSGLTDPPVVCLRIVLAAIEPNANVGFIDRLKIPINRTWGSGSFGYRSGFVLGLIFTVYLLSRLGAKTSALRSRTSDD